MNRSESHPFLSGRATAFVCGGLLSLFTVISAAAISTKNPTYDEPLHLLAAWAQTHQHDFRINPEDPPLFKYWVAVPLGRDALSVSTDDPFWNSSLRRIEDGEAWVLDMAFHHGNHIDAAIAQGRMIMLMLGVALGALLAWWAWRLAGSVAAIAATVLFSFDPNFLAHAALIKNDVAMTLVLAALMYVVWLAGQRLTLLRAIAICLLCGAAVTVKFSGILVGPLLVLVFAIRAMLPQSWICFGKSLVTRPQRLAAAAGLCLAAAVISYISIWAVYQFRFGPSPDPSVSYDFNFLLAETAANQESATTGGVRRPFNEMAGAPQTAGVRLLLSLREHHIFPESWIAGLLFTHKGILYRGSFLVGEHNHTGWWYYFPLAMLFKTPLATLAAAAGALILAIGPLRRKVFVSLSNDSWPATCLAVPVIWYLGNAMHTHLSIGVRHVLPVYPFLYLMIACSLAAAWEQWPRRARWAAIILTLALAAETLAAFPDYIPFFNVAAGGSRGGLKLLSDSNLDWGQDLKELSLWQRANPDRVLDLAYFGQADPAYYRIRSRDLFQDRTAAAQPHVVAISATYLQDMYLTPQMRLIIAPYRTKKPFAVLGGSIYLFESNPP